MHWSCILYVWNSVCCTNLGELHLLMCPLWRHKVTISRTSVAHCAKSGASSGSKGWTFLISAQLGDRLAHRQPLSAHAARCEYPPLPPVKPCVSLHSWEMRAGSGSTPLVMARKRNIRVNFKALFLVSKKQKKVKKALFKWMFHADILKNHGQWVLRQWAQRR